MVKYITAEPGYMYSLTALGAEENKVRAKFDKTNKCYKQYIHSVPESWLQKGWVVKIKEEYQCVLNFGDQ